MAKTYIKLWESYDRYFEPLSEIEVGRLVLAMMEYKRSGTVPEFAGNEKFIWPAVQRDLDEDITFTERQSEREKASKAKRKQAAASGSNTGQAVENAGKPKKSATRFTPPTADEVRAYCTEKGYRLDAEQFVDYYTTRGWKLKSGTMHDWKSAVRTWVRMDKERQPEKPKYRLVDGVKFYD